MMATKDLRFCGFVCFRPDETLRAGGGLTARGSGLP